MEITYSPSEKKDIVRIHCPECGERVRNIGLDPDKCILTVYPADAKDAVICLR